MPTRISFLLVLLLLFSSPFLYGAEKQKLSIQEIYELQERCGKSSDEFFKKTYSTGYNSIGVISFYESHYNKKLNKCFIKMAIITKSEKDDGKDTITMEVYDVQEYSQYGFFSESPEKMKCLFRGINCNSKLEWNLLAKPYMEE